MKSALAAAVFAGLATSATATPVDLTGNSCVQMTSRGPLTWEFYGDVTIRYFGDGSVSSLPRAGVGAYERYNYQGEWQAIYYFFDSGDGLKVRVLSRAGLVVRIENPNAPLELNVIDFDAACFPLSGQ